MVINIPKYDFKCPKCGNKEYYLGINEERPTNCEDCGSEITRDYSAMNFPTMGAIWNTDCCHKVFRQVETTHIKKPSGY